MASFVKCSTVRDTGIVCRHFCFVVFFTCSNTKHFVLESPARIYSSSPLFILFCGTIKLNIYFKYLLLKLVPSNFKYFTRRKHLKDYEKYFLFDQKVFSCSRDNQTFLFSFLSISRVDHCWIYSRSWLNVDPKVHDVVICLNKNLRTQEKVWN